MHSVIYRTQLLRDCGMELPKHTFYVDNIFAYQPLPSVKSIYYMDVDLYRYFIGRADQSVNEKVMIGRVDQQVRVTRHMISACDLNKVIYPKLARYMKNYLAMMMSIALRFIPTLIEETDKIMNAQKARGAQLDNGKMTERIKALIPVLVPLFISAFRRADELAMAMECRCYRGGDGRTRLKVLRCEKQDYIDLAVCIACFAVILASRLVFPNF